MRYLFRPSPAEELLVRGRYDVVAADGTVWATEQWERYGPARSFVETRRDQERGDWAEPLAQAWRSEWKGAQDGQTVTLLSHTVLSDEGIERLKLRLVAPDHPSQTLTLTTMADAILVNDEGKRSEVALPPGYALLAPLPSLARFAFPFDLASEQREIGMVFLLRARSHAGEWHMRPVKFGYTPLGLRDFEVNEQPLRGRGWRMEVPGLPAQEGWFDRNGTCLLWRVDDGARGWEARLAEWMRFG